MRLKPQSIEELVWVERGKPSKAGTLLGSPQGWVHGAFFTLYPKQFRLEAKEPHQLNAFIDPPKGKS